MFRFGKLLALAAGALSATGFAPLGAWPVTLACLALLIELIARAPNARGAFVRGWAFGVGHFTVGLNWIAHAFTYQEAMPHWFGYGAVALLSLYLAVFPGVAALIAWAVASYPVVTAEVETRVSTSRAIKGGTRTDTRSAWAHSRSVPHRAALVFALAAAWIATEWLRATLFTGFAWNPLAVVTVGRWLDQSAALIGTYALSGLVVLIAGALWLSARRAWTPVAAIAGGVALLAAAAPFASRAGPEAAPLRVQVVQPNQTQDEKHDEGAVVRNLLRLVRMSGSPGPTPRLLLWPEAAIDNGLLLAEDPALRGYLARLLGPGDLLLTGGVALERDRAGEAVGARNSVFVLGPDARIRARYDKAHLVPYGEYLPMRPLLTPLGLARLVPGDLDFWPGPGPRSLDLPGIGPVGFQICYEVIFSGAVIDPARRPRFMFNPSNDAWFGRWGPPQHLAQARLRAVEEGMTIVRATPTGISAVIAPTGRLVAQLGLNRAGVLDTLLPAPVAPTPFARAGNLLAGLLALALAALAIVFRVRER